MSFPTWIPCPVLCQMLWTPEMAFIDFMGQLNCIAKNSFQIENLLWEHLSTKRIMVVRKKADKNVDRGMAIAVHYTMTTLIL